MPTPAATTASSSARWRRWAAPRITRCSTIAASIPGLLTYLRAETVSDETPSATNRRATPVSPVSFTSPPTIILPPSPLPKEADYTRRAQQLAELHDEIAVCQKCVVAGYLARADTVGATRGRIGDRVMVVGQAPGHLSVERGMPFAGP